MQPILIAASLLALAAAASAQTTWLVGPNGIPDLQNAIDGAAAGDELVLEPGTYPPFNLDKALTMRAETNGTVQITSGGFVLPLATNTSGRTQFVGLDFQELNCFGGDFSIIDCTFAWTGSVLSLANGTAHVERTTVLGLPSLLGNVGPLFLSGAYVTMVDCEVEGSAPSPFGVNGPAVDQQANSTLVASGCTFRAGTGPILQPTIVSQSNTVVRISDSTFAHDASVCTVTGPADVVLSRCVVPSSCPNQVVAPLLGIGANGAITRGQVWSATFRGEPNEPLLVFGSDDLDGGPAIELDGPFLLAAAGCFPAAAILLDGNGDAQLDVPIPGVAIPVGLAVFVQGVSGSSVPLRASPVVGGLVR